MGLGGGHGGRRLAVGTAILPFRPGRGPCADRPGAKDAAKPASVLGRLDAAKRASVLARLTRQSRRPS
ncbi:hypothetical protein GLA29479_1662 [Lysobacter antibioticus]|uniref:Uncharacterized protein n=1 Tax=Lysobacter antibioticus TaxID=84531 RepID=A0A0S2F9S6_LYSAN|nr:hypothetical protein GLA29479_1662 [Lysobacter antibioticus]ALN80312.1 hypothetical protein LA76x_2173 [Lysobacter antibioticus]